MATQSNTPFHTPENVLSKNLLPNAIMLVTSCEVMYTSIKEYINNKESRPKIIKGIELMWDNFCKKIDIMNSRMGQKLVVCQNPSFDDVSEPLDNKFGIFVLNLSDLTKALRLYSGILEKTEIGKTTIVNITDILDTLWNDVCMIGKLFN